MNVVQPKRKNVFRFSVMNSSLIIIKSGAALEGMGNRISDALSVFIDSNVINFTHFYSLLSV